MSHSSEWVPSVWMDTFNELLSDDSELDYEDQWTFNFSYRQTEKLTTEERKRGWKISNPHVHGKFQCASCKNIWSSARVVLLFRYRLRSGRGIVIMRPFGQACRRCKNYMFCLPGVSNTNVEEALLKLFAKIRKNCYGEKDDNDIGSQQKNFKLTKPHESTLCEACQTGICNERVE
ncbi:receptor-transporting protein 3-like isoform X1 [Embiotoca jacksoni]|uniref:receptor-transporting protein 3-like isoform X1 n=1 Tax=Embiotoca jacksoni TaxID=100190 RepID=UPI003703898D